MTVHFGGWDHHWDLKAGMERYLPMVDQCVAALFDDLTVRGLYDNVLVVLCGEFSRTPRMNNGGNGGPPGSMGTPGRDHWGNAMFCLIGGGGIRGGGRPRHQSVYDGARRARSTGFDLADPVDGLAFALQHHVADFLSRHQGQA